MGMHKDQQEDAGQDLGSQREAGSRHLQGFEQETTVIELGQQGLPQRPSTPLWAWLLLIAAVGPLPPPTPPPLSPSPFLYHLRHGVLIPAVIIVVMS